MFIYFIIYLESKVPIIPIIILAHMLYMRLKLKFYQKNLRAHGQHMRLN